MSLEITLANALSGLSASQLSLQTVSNNIANARTEGYTRKIIDQTSRVLDGVGYGVEITRITREVDAGVQRLLRTETGNESELKQKDKFLQH